MSPEQFLKTSVAYLANLEKAKSMGVYVGLPAEKVGGAIYGDGMTVIQIGAIHEYGLGNNPERSFLRTPLSDPKQGLNKFINNQFKLVLERGRDAEQALGLVGTKAVNISKGAFRSKGYGVWVDIKPETKRRKGSSQTLIDTGTLRNSITYIVR